MSYSKDIFDQFHKGNVSIKASSDINITGDVKITGSVNLNHVTKEVIIPLTESLQVKCVEVGGSTVSQELLWKDLSLIKAKIRLGSPMGIEYLIKTAIRELLFQLDELKGSLVFKDPAIRGKVYNELVDYSRLHNISGYDLVKENKKGQFDIVHPGTGITIVPYIQRTQTKGLPTDDFQYQATFKRHWMLKKTLDNGMSLTHVIELPVGIEGLNWDKELIAFSKAQ